MTGTQSTPAEPTADPRALLEDWLTIWQSELAGLLVDPEAQAAVLRYGAAWAAMVRAAAGAFAAPGVGHEPAERPAGPHAAAGAAAVAAASGGAGGTDVRDAAIERLLVRVAELERRLDGGRSA